MSNDEQRIAEAWAHYHAGAFGKCADICEALLTSELPNAEAEHLAGRLAERAGNLELALDFYERAAGNEPTGVSHLYAEAAVLRKLARDDDAIAALSAAIRLEPAFAAAHFMLGNIWKDRRALEDALPHYETAAHLEPDNADFAMNAGAAQRELENLDAALSWTDAALEADPDHTAARWNRAQILLLMEDFERGWEAYPTRFGSSPKAFPYRHGDKPEWNGEIIDDRKLLLWGDQGMGDELICGSLIREAASRAKSVMLECEPKLAPLISRSFPNLEVIPRSTPADERTRDKSIRAQKAWGDLPAIFRRRKADFISDAGYLKADESRVAAHRESYNTLGRGPKVGIAWESANPLYKEKVDVPLALWAPIFAVPNVRFVSVQYKAEREMFERVKAPVHLDASVDAWSDIDGWAAQMASLDLVISISNSATCLAAALGVKTWAMLSTAPEFYYGMTSEQCLWFEGLRFFRQESRGDWQTVTANVATALSEFAQNDR